jgi:ABC-2 type transport system permease protein
VLVRLLGPRGARAFGQILAALLGAMVFLIVQFANQRQRFPAGGRMGGFIAWLREHGLGAEGWSATPARAVLGEPLPLLTFLLFAVVLFAGTSIAFRRHFLLGYQKAGDRGTAPTRARKKDGGQARNLFAGGLLRAIVAKELRLILRQPEIIFMMVLRLIYLAPLVFIGVNAGGSAALGVPMLAAVGAVAAGQLTGSVAWLTISAEDAPDLLAVSPVASLKLKRLKLVAALIIVAPFALIVPAIIAARDPAAALVAFIGALAAGYAGGAIEMRFGKPQKRSNFTKRQEGSFLVSLLSLFVAMIVGALTAAAAWLV